MMHTLVIAMVSLWPAPEGARRVLIGADLSRQSVMVDRIDAGSIGIVDVRGVRRSVPANDVLAMYAERMPRRVTVDGARAVGLTDGQMLVGSVGSIAGDADAMLVRHPVLGEMRVTLDQTMWITGADAPALTPATGDDTVVLANGDLLTGFVGGIVRAEDGSAAVEFEPATGSPIEVGLESVLSVVIANNAEPARGPRIWLADGSSVALREIADANGGESGLVRVSPVLAVARSGEPSATEGGQAELNAEMPMLAAPGSLVLDHVVGWMPEAGRLVALAGLKVLSVEPTAPRPWTEGPVLGDAARSALGAADVLLPGPSRIEWELPAGVDGLTCEVTLPEAYRDWGDCEVVILTGGGLDRGAGDGALTERWRGRVNAENPTLPVAIEMADRPTRLIVAVEAGAFGPVQDRPTLVTPLVRMGAINGP